jgi:hypothetical protein
MTDKKQIRNLVFEAVRDAPANQTRRWTTPEGIAIYATPAQMDALGVVNVPEPLDIDFIICSKIYEPTVHKTLAQLLDLAYPSTISSHKHYRVQIKEIE